MLKRSAIVILAGSIQIALMQGMVRASSLYSAIDLSTLPGSDPYFVSSYPVSINNRGQVVGNFYGPGGVPTGFLTSGGRIALLPQVANRINDRGQVVLGGGDSGRSLSIYDKGVVTPIPNAPKDDRSWMAPINNSGVVLADDSHFHQILLADGKAQVGTPVPGYIVEGAGLNDSNQVIANAYWGMNGPGKVHSFLIDGSHVQDLGALGGVGTQSKAINAAGQIVGSSGIPTTDPNLAYSRFHAFLWEVGSMKDLGTLGGEQSTAMAINAKGEIVGNSFTVGMDPTSYHAFLYQDGVMIDLNSMISDQLGWTLRDASGINDAGQIIASAKDGTGRSFAVLLNPEVATLGPETPPDVPQPPQVVPEPSTVALFGLVGIVAWLRKRRRP